MTSEQLEDSIIDLNVNLLLIETEFNFLASTGGDLTNLKQEIIRISKQLTYLNDEQKTH